MSLNFITLLQEKKLLSGLEFIIQTESLWTGLPGTCTGQTLGQTG